MADIFTFEPIIQPHPYEIRRTDRGLPEKLLRDHCGESSQAVFSGLRDILELRKTVRAGGPELQAGRVETCFAINRNCR